MGSLTLFSFAKEPNRIFRKFLLDLWMDIPDLRPLTFGPIREVIIRMEISDAA